MYISKYPKLRLDYYLGLRCKYLILYGVLPASLISLGVVQVDTIALPEPGVSLIALLIIACVPVFVTYSLIKFKVDQYYLIKGDIIKRSNNKEYRALFSWDNVPGSDSERLLKFLWDDLNIDWAKNAEIRKSYLFSWDNISGKDDEKLRKFLKDDLNIDWAENAEIHKSNDNTTISIYNDENTAEILIDEKKKKAILKISDGRTHDLKVKTENGKLNIYRKSNDGMTISISKDENSAEIVINEKKEKATLKIRDVITYDLKAKKENGKLNIYEYTKRCNNKKYIKEYNNIRASFMTFVILILAAIVSMANGVILGQYSITSNLTSWIQPCIESLLTAAISLVVSSALFMTILRENVDFPGLQPKSYVDRVSSIKDCMSKVTKTDRLIWDTRCSKEKIEKFKNYIYDCEKEIQNLQPLKNEKYFIAELNKDINKLKSSAKNLLSPGVEWEMYFAESYDRKKLDKEQKKRRASINKLSCTRW